MLRTNKGVQVEENALMGKLAFEEVQARLENDLFLSSLIESGAHWPLATSKTLLTFNPFQR